MNSLSDSPNGFKSIQEQLITAENDTKELAKMLLDLGISPKLTDEEIPLCQDILNVPGNTDANPSQENKKSVTFASNVKNYAKPPSILKRTPLPPLTIHSNSPSPGNQQYKELVTRLCKTESVIQSLQLSLYSMQSSKEVVEKEKRKVIRKLKAEIQEKVEDFKKAVQLVKKTEAAHKDTEERWRAAEKEVRLLQEKLQNLNVLNTTQKNNTSKELDAAKDKSAKKIMEMKKELEQERELRASLEESHNSLLTRVNDMEETVERERKEVLKLNEECSRLNQENSKFKLQASEYTDKAVSLETLLNNLKREIDDKERAIQKLIQEQVSKDMQQTSINNDRLKLENEIQNYNVLLDAQRESYEKLEKENIANKTDLENSKSQIDKLKCEIDAIKKENMNKINQKEKETKSEILESERQSQQILRAEIAQRNELEDRVKILEDTVQQQEKIIQEKQTDIIESDKNANEKVEKLKREINSLTKEKDQYFRAKEDIETEIKRLKNSIQSENTLIQEQIQELQLELKEEAEAKRILKEENGRLLERVAAIQQQEGMYKRMQENLHSVNQAKSKLAYDKGKLQSRVEQLEQEIQSCATAQSHIIQLTNSNNTIEQKFTRQSTDFANAKVELQRYQAQVNQMQAALQRKEDEFAMAIASRDEAIMERNEIEKQKDLFKEQENAKSFQMKQSIIECRNDNARLANDLETITERHNKLQETIDALQLSLGRKDNELNGLLRDKENYEILIKRLRHDLSQVKSDLNCHQEQEENRLQPLIEAMEQAREDNLKLAGSLDEVLKANSNLENEVINLKSEIQTKNKQLQSLERREESLITEAENITQIHSSRITDVKEQLKQEKELIRKSLQEKCATLKSKHEEVQRRCSQLSHGNAELRSKFAEKEKVVLKLQQQNKSLKQTVDRLQRHKNLNSARSVQIGEVTTELEKLEATKKLYMEKNKEQAETIAAFNAEIESLRGDVMALGAAQSQAKSINKRLGDELKQERKSKIRLENDLEDMSAKYEDIKLKKASVDERLKKAKAESVLIQKNLTEAQGWFKDKFSMITNELGESKRVKMGGGDAYLSHENKENIK